MRFKRFIYSVLLILFSLILAADLAIWFLVPEAASVSAPDSSSFPQGMTFPSGGSFPSGDSLPEGVTLPEVMSLPEGEGPTCERVRAVKEITGRISTLIVGAGYEH